MGRRQSAVTLLFLCLVAAGLGQGYALAAKPSPPSCDEVPTGVKTDDYFLHFQMPAGLMPDQQFDRRQARIEVHRVSPVYANGRCESVPSRAAVLVHGRIVNAAPTFDLRHPATGGGDISVQESLARQGIDTFAPNLLGYGRSTGFENGLNDPGNASLPSAAAGPCPPPGCDKTHNPIFTLNQQKDLLWVNPLNGQYRAHSSNVRFAGTDVWVRDIRHAIDDAITRARPTDGKVALVGYSLGGQRVVRTLYAANPNPALPGSADTIAKVSKLALIAPFGFGGPTEESPPPAGFVSFPLTLVPINTQPVTLPPECTGAELPGFPEQIDKQLREDETVGRDWGGTDPAQPTGLLRRPTFSSYGYTATTVGQLTPPTLVIGGRNDATAPPAVHAVPTFNALPAAMTNKVLVQIDCASHQFITQVCGGERCQPASGTPYGGTPGAPWRGPHSTVTTALTEWITNGTFNGAASGRFNVDKSGVASPG